MVTRYVLLEWVGKWAIAWRGSGEVAPLFDTIDDADEWIVSVYGDSPEWDRFHYAEIHLPESEDA